MRLKLRLIPVVIAAAALLLGVKTADLWSVISAQAATSEEEKPAATPAKPAALPATAAKPVQKPVASAETKPAEAKPAEAAAEQAADPLLMSPSEIEVLQKLSERRAALDQRAAEMAQREVLLKAAEQRIDEKVAKLQSLQQEIGGAVDKQEEQEDQRTKSLVKIYETMKPKEAARIFEDLDLAVLLQVVERMKEAKAAPILASMDPSKARTVTMALADRREKRSRQTVAQGGAQKPPSP